MTEMSERQMRYFLSDTHPPSEHDPCEVHYCTSTKASNLHSTKSVLTKIGDTKMFPALFPEYGEGHVKAL